MAMPDLSVGSAFGSVATFSKGVSSWSFSQLAHLYTQVWAHTFFLLFAGREGEESCIGSLLTSRRILCVLLDEGGILLAKFGLNGSRIVVADVLEIKGPSQGSTPVWRQRT